jgi:hypothetical protein
VSAGRDPHLIEIEAGTGGRLNVILDGAELRGIRSLSFTANKAPLCVLCCVAATVEGFAKEFSARFYRCGGLRNTHSAMRRAMCSSGRRVPPVLDGWG